MTTEEIKKGIVEGIKNNNLFGGQGAEGGFMDLKYLLTRDREVISGEEYIKLQDVLDILIPIN